MADLSRRTALRMGQPRLGGSVHIETAAQSLNAALARRRHSFAAFGMRTRWIGAAVATAAMLTAIVFLPSGPVAQAKPPLYVADAVEAFQTGLLRADMPSQIETAKFDPRDVQRFTRIRVPQLPRGWRITDAQLFPSDEGPALQIMIRTAANKTVSIFAVRSAAKAPSIPVTVSQGDAAVAYWRTGDIAYALTGVEAPAALDVAAEDLANNQLG